jgi:outer membrane protein
MFFRSIKFKHKNVQLIIIALTYPLMTWPQNLIFENNIDILSNKTKTESTYFETKMNKSLFLPEFSINTGLGSEYILDNAEKKQGPYLYVEGKINLYKGGRDLNQEKINQLTLIKLDSEREILIRKTKTSAFKLISNIKTIEIDNHFLEEEIKENDNQLKMARKKVDAGLTSPSDLLDFQIKSETLQNEIAINELKISDLKKDLELLLGDKLTFEKIENELRSIDQLVIKSNLSTNNPEIQFLKNSISVSQIELLNIKSEYLPILELEGKYGNITPNSKLFENKIEHQVLLNLNIPLFSGLTTDAKKNKAILELTQRERELRQLKFELEKKSLQEKIKIELNEKITATLEKSLEKSSKYKEITITEYKRGVKNSSDVVNASDKKLDLIRKINELKHEKENLIYSFNINFL